MIIITKNQDHVTITADDGDTMSGALEEAHLTPEGWASLRAKTPEARALRELVEALEGGDESHATLINRAIGYGPELASAVQEARVLVRRLPTEESA